MFTGLVSRNSNGDKFEKVSKWDEVEQGKSKNKIVERERYSVMVGWGEA